MSEVDPATGKVVCGARNRTGGTCRLAPIPGRTRCKFHGGMSLRGEDHPMYKDGRYAYASMPERYRAAFLRARNSPELLELRDSIAVVDARIDELFGQLSRSESGAVWARVNDARLEVLSLAHQLAEARRSGDEALAAEVQQAQGAAISQLLAAVEQGGKEAETWSQILEAVERRRRLSESEARRIFRERDYIPRDGVAALVGFIMRVMAKASTVEEARREILDGYLQMVGQTATARLASGGEDGVEGEEPDEDAEGEGS